MSDSDVYQQSFRFIHERNTRTTDRNQNDLLRRVSNKCESLHVSDEFIQLKQVVFCETVTAECVLCSICAVSVRL